MIEITGISKTYTTKVLDDIEYKFMPGKIYVIKGVSGCGKSTLLNILGGLDRDFEGEYLFFGENIKTLGEDDFNKFRKKVGYIYQHSLLLSNLTILENLCFIKNCPESIKTYADRLGVADLLNKYPEQLSGGERQRFSVIRALLNDPVLIIADEPTASLDNDNSRKIAEMMAGICRPDNIVIISTHEDCFDDIADEIIDLNYGRIGAVIKNDNPAPQDTAIICEEKKKYPIIKYIFSRNKAKMKFSKLLPSVIIIMVLLFCLAVQRNFQGEYIKIIFENYPMTVFPIPNHVYERIHTKYDLKVYDNYVIEENGVICLPLLDEKDSGLSYDQVIQYGRFPQKSNEVVVSQEYVDGILDIKSYDDCIGKRIVIGADTYTIAGVLSDLKNERHNTLVYYNDYYSVDNPYKIFIPYETIKENGKLVETERKMVMFSELYNNKANYNYLREELHGNISVWDKIVMDLQYAIDKIYLIIIAAVCLVAFIALLFINNEIQLELYYRRKEIGYLQVFNVPQNRLKQILVWERVLRTALALGYALILYLATVTICISFFDINGFLPVPVLALFIAVILLYSIVLVYFPCAKFLKRDIITLIT
jgi:ABC-type lipoprotein export system ATPase subunit